MTWNERKFVNDVLAQNVKDVLAQNVNDVMLDTACTPYGLSFFVSKSICKIDFRFDLAHCVSRFIGFVW